jgi:signal transduction histidine kinase
MVSYIHLLKHEGLDSPNAPEYLEILDSKTQRLKVLTENLFEAAKASSGAIPVNMEDIDLSSMLTQTLAEMEEKLSARNLAVQIKNECENMRVRADGQLLWRVLENLLGNVSKYALENSRVYIDLSEHNVGENGFVKIEVKNISKDELNISADELMERFKRGDESRNTEGSGLGLAIAKDLVQMMNGIFEITVDGDLFKAIVMLEKAN